MFYKIKKRVVNLMKICTSPFKDKIEYATVLEKYSKIKK